MNRNPYIDDDLAAIVNGSAQPVLNGRYRPHVGEWVSATPTI